MKTNRRSNLLGTSPLVSGRVRALLSLALAWASLSTVVAQTTVTNVITGVIDVPGERDVFTFSVAADARFYFDSLTNTSAVQWSLKGPPGTVVANRSFDGSDAQNVGDPTVALPVGDYTLTVQAPNAVTSGYAFRLVNLAEATLLVPGTVVTNNLSPANKSDFYQFGALAGDQFYFQQIARVGLPNAYWRLLDPYGNQVFSRGFNDVGTPAAPVTVPATGAYTLLLEGYIRDTGNGSYAFNVVPEGHVDFPEFTGTALNFGDLIVGDLPANATSNYIFTVASPLRALFDTQTNSPNLYWTLQGPSGLVVNQRGLNGSDWANGVGPWQLATGDYQLRVQSANGGPYAFRLLDLALATVMVPGNSVTNFLSPSSAVAPYQFTIGSAGRYYFDYVSSAGLNNAYWRLVDPYNHSIFNGGLSSDQGPLALPNPGTYTLLIEGYYSDIGNGSNVFRVLPVTDGFQALTLGNVVSEAITSPGQRQQYTFTLGSPAQLYFDVQTNASQLRWSLDGPIGNVVSSSGFTWDTLVGNLLPGDYTLTVFANGDNTGDYQFKLFDLGTATPVIPGTSHSDTLSPASAAKAYQFSLAAAGRFFFDSLSSSGLPNASWKLLGPRGQTVFDTSLSSDQGPIVLAIGNYTLLVSGYPYELGSGAFEFNVLPVVDGTQALTLGGGVNGAVGSPGQQQRYTFTLAAPTRLYFDSFTNASQLRWSLNGPTGNVMNNGGFGADAMVSAPAAGDYTLTVFANGDYLRDYQFRLIDLATAPALVPGAAVSDSLNPASSTQAYQFTLATAGKYFFDIQSTTGLPSASWQLLNGRGEQVFHVGLGSDAGPYNLRADTYTLLVQGYLYDPGIGTYTLTVVPVTDSRQPLSFGGTVTSAITMPGQWQQYEFTLPTAARLYFDSLTNSSQFRWTLSGPTGNLVSNRPFSGSDAQSVNAPVMGALAGSYTLTVSATGDTIGGYQFRLLNLANASPLTAGTPVSAALNPANATMVYRFAVGSAGKYFFDSRSTTGLPSAYWRLIDPAGTEVFGTGLASDRGPLNLNRMGTYHVLIEGYVSETGSGDFTFNVQPVTDGSQNMTLGGVVSGAIGVPGQAQNYAFTLGTAARLYFDSLTENPQLRWSLVGPTGSVINNRSFTGSDAQSVGTPILSVPAGSYTLTVFGNGDNTGSYQFRLFDLATATTLTPGTPVGGTLAPGNSTIAFRFTVTAGDQFLFDHQNSTGLPSVYWRLIDPYDRLLFGRLFNSDAGTYTLADAGTYLLLIEGFIGNPDPGSFGFNVQPSGNVPPVTLNGTPLTEGSPVAGTLATSTSTNSYTFSLAAPERLYFDALTNLGFQWSLLGPGGHFVANRSFQGSDSTDITDPLLRLPAGDYQLNVTGAAGDYAFRLLNLSGATTFTPDTPVTGTLTPGNSTVFYQFSANAGDPFYFDGQPTSGFNYQPYTRIYGPLGNIIRSIDVHRDVDTFTAPQTGIYTLTVEGRIYDPNASGNYAFNLIPQDYPTTELVVGTLVEGTIPKFGQRNLYTFTLPVESTLYFDALTNANFSWRLDAPWGQVVDWRGIANSDSQEIVNPALALSAGDYTLTVAYSGYAGTGDYAFRLLDFADATPMTPGTVVSGSLAPGSATVLYQFSANAGDPFYFDGQPTSGFNYQPYTRIYGPLGNVIRSVNVHSDIDTFTLPQTGTYTLTVEGRIYDPNTSGDYAFNLIPQDYPTTELVVGTLVEGTIPKFGQRNLYTFTLPVEATLYFDALTNANLSWRLDAPWGQVVDWRGFVGADSQDITNPALALAAGDYTLTVAYSGYAGTGDYAFRLLDFADAAPMTPGTVVSGSLAPGNSTVLYQFTASAGDLLYFDGQPTSGFNYQPYTRIYGPLGNIIRSVNVHSDADTFTLPQTGTYTLTVEGRIYDANASGSYAFNLVPQDYPTTALLVGETVVGTIPQVGQRNLYSFELPFAATLYFDALTNVNCSWRLDAAWGQVTDWRGFASSDSLDIGDPALSLAAGAYTLTLAGNGFNTTSDYAFRLLDFANAVEFTPGTTVTNTLAPASSTTFHRFSGNAGDRYYFDGQPVSGFSYHPRTRIYGPLGNIIRTVDVSSDLDTFTIAQTGTYTLTVEGRVYDANPSGGYAFNLVPNPVMPPEPIFETDVTADLIVSGVSVTPTSGLQSGGVATVHWTDSNVGNGATSGSFTDRVTIRNAANLVLVDAFLPYPEGDVGNGPIPGGGGRSRQLSVTLPEGPNSTGTLQVTVTTDAQNAIAESNEANNGTSQSFTVDLASYPDLQVAMISATPPTGWLPGSVVTINWRSTNSGSGIASASWVDSVVVRNTNTTQVIFSGTKVYNLADAGNGPIVAGGYRDRSLAFTLPTGTGAYGAFAITVSADSGNQLFEYRADGSAEANNATTAVVNSAPDVTVSGLTVSPPIGSIVSGSTITISWNDENTGTVETGTSFSDRITVVNTDTTETLLNTTVHYNAATAGNGPIVPGGSKARSTTLTLPDGPRAVGLLRIEVVADTFNQLPEVNGTGTGESNNSANTTVSSTIAAYPDFQVYNLTIQPDTMASGTNVTIQWEDVNTGTAIATQNWHDRIMIVNTNSGATLLDTPFFYNANTLGPLTNGTARSRSYNFTLPDGPTAVGQLQFRVTADTYNAVFEYNPAGTGESNNTASVVVGSSIAPYPDLEVINIQVEPTTLASGTNVTVRWQDANTGTAPALDSWYDRLSVVNTNIGVTLLETAVYHDVGDLGALTNGTARDRSYSFALPYTTNGTGNLLFTVTADAFDYVFEYNAGGTGENNNSNSIVRFSDLTPLADLIVTDVATPANALTDQALTVQFKVTNQGVLAAEGNISQRVFVSSTPTAGSGVLAAVSAFNGPLEPGQSTNQTVTLQTPSAPGTYWLIVQTDGSENVQELSEANNAAVSATPFTVQPAYTATLVVDLPVALANTPIPMHGLATRGDTGLPAAFSPVKIHVLVRGTDRTYDVLTAADGTFTNVFYPLPNEAGNYQVAAAFPNLPNPPAQASFTLIGMSVNRVPLTSIVEETSVTNRTVVANLSDVPLTGLSVSVITNQANLSVSASLDANTLAGFGTANLELAVTALDASVYQSPVVLELTSDEGATATLIVTVRVEALRPKLVTTPSSLNGAMVRGTQTPFAFTVANTGGVATGPMEIALPNAPWLSLASSNLLPPLPPGTNTSVTLLLNPAADLPLGDYTGSLVIQSTNAGLSVPYSFRAISAAKGNLLLSVEDEYTYFVDGSPRVTNAMVVLSDALSRAPVTTNYTGADGTLLLTNLTEAFYIIDVAATNHSAFRQTALVAAGSTTNVVAFLTRQTVRYSFTVVPTTVEDSYIFTVDSTFETQVPVPVVTISPSSIDLSQYPGTEFQVLLTVRNHGLIDADEVKLNIPSTPVLQLTPLVTNLGKLKANSSLTVPMLVRRTPPPAPLGTSTLRPQDYLSGECSVTGEMLWNYLCGPNVVDKSTAFYAFDSTGCDLVALYRQVYHLVPDGGGGGVGPVIDSDDFFDYLSSLNPVLDFEAPPGYHFECNASPGDPFSPNAVRTRSGGMALQGDTKRLFGDNDVCAKVQLRLDQKAVLTRDAFKATLEIDNDVPVLLENLQVDLTIIGAGGASVNTNFSISSGDLSGFTALDGTGSLSGNTVGTANWTLIPTLEAAPTNGVALYLVGGTLSYRQDGVDLSIPLGPAPIQVYPQPELAVRYFHDREVYADDPFTPQIEPSIPYSLAVQVNNVGYGPARALSITSGKPQIVENIKGLLIDFNILGAQVENQSVTPALDVNFGEVGAGTNKVARWLFTSPLQGSFTNFSASFKQVSPFGDPRLSLIRSVDIHELTHIVDVNGPQADGRVDFLVNDLPDPDFLPDTIYLSDGSSQVVNAVTNAAVTGSLGPANLSVLAGAAAPAGCSYFRFQDPGLGQYRLTRVLRSDGSEVPFGTNVWTTDRIFQGGDERPILTNLVHLVDYNSSGDYTLFYEQVMTVNDTAAPSSQVVALPPASTPSFTVQWSGADNPGGSGISSYDVYVSVNGGAFTRWITNATFTAAIYSGTENSQYAFQSQAIDVAGNREAPHPTADAQTTASAPGNTAPIVAPIPPQSVAEGALFSFLPSATDADVPAQTLTWSLLPGAPSSALISPSNGRIRWQTQPSDGGSTATFTVMVTDSGSPGLSASQSFTVQVVDTNHPPVIVPPGPQVVVDEETLLSLQMDAVDPDVGDSLTWSMTSAAPDGMNLDSANGRLTWSPTEAQGPGSYLVTIVARDHATPPLSDTNTFTILVKEVNRPPVLSTFGTQTADVLSPLFLSYTATDPDLPVNSLGFSLGSGAPASASMDATTGQFSWVPARDRAGTTNHITMVVTDSGAPPLTHSNTLTVVVGHYVEAIWGSTLVEAGQPSSVPLTLDVSAPVANVDFTLDISDAGLTDFTLTEPTAPWASATLQEISPRQFRISLRTLDGQAFSGMETVANLGFAAEANARSAFVRLQVSALAANQPDGLSISRALSSEGVVTLVNVEPLLVARLTGGALRELTLFGKPGSSYQLQYATDLAAENPWQDWIRVPMTEVSTSVEPINPGTPNLFLKAFEFIADPPIIDSEMDADHKLSLTLYGRPNAGYQLQHRGDLSSSGDWSLWEAYTPTNSFYFIKDLSPTNSIIFFHIAEP